MDDIVVTILVCVGVVAVITVLFGGWFVMSLIGGARRLIDRGTSRFPTGATSVGRACANPGCRMVNPPHARFCRRCGTDLGHIAGPLARGDNQSFRTSEGRSKIAL